MTRVLIVDDERNIQKAFRSDIMSASDRYELVDCIVNAADALLVCGAKNIDLVLMDINTANNESGLVAAENIKKRYPGIKIIMTTSYTDPEALKEAQRIGVESFWFKDYSNIELVEVMDRTVNADGYMPEEAPDVKLGETTIHRLTDTEKEVLHNLVECVSIKRIAEKMFIEETTVKTHLKSIYNKVGCNNKTELLLLAMQSKLVLPPKRQ
ncbi:MAG: response regulator transcription factor [Eubacteriales bacterium]|nr:response regulator transcription factor [Eubacteriales bacterium]